MRFEELEGQFAYFRKLTQQHDDSLRLIREQQALLETSLRGLVRTDLFEQLRAAQLAYDSLNSNMLESFGLAKLAHEQLFNHDLMRQVQQAAAMVQSFEKINNQVAAADLRAAFTVFSESEEPGDGEVETAEEIRTELVTVVSAETLHTLERVEFAPLTFLSRAIHHPEIIRGLDGRAFEEFVALLIDQLGFDGVKLTPRSNDGGRDILATKTVHGVPVLFAFECKRYAEDRVVGPDVARALLGTISHRDTPATMGVLVTTSRFSRAAKKFIVAEPRLDGKDFEGVVGWIREAAIGRRLDA